MASSTNASNAANAAGPATGDPTTTTKTTKTVIEIAKLKGLGDSVIVKVACTKINRVFVAEGWNMWEMDTYVFTPPYSEELLPAAIRAENALRLSPLGLTWDEGNTPYSELNGILQRACSGEGENHTIYARGEINCQFLSDLLGKTVLNYPRDNAPSWADT
jgi:hypothetical protein